MQYSAFTEPCRNRPTNKSSLVFTKLFICQCCGSGSTLLLVRWIQISVENADPYPDQGGQTLPTKIEKSDKNFMFWSAGCAFLRAEGFSCSLDILCLCLGIRKLQFLKKKILIFSSCNFFEFFVIETLDPEPDSHWNQRGSQHYILYISITETK